MARDRLLSDSDGDVNPYIAFSDLVVSVALVFVLCVALGKLGLLDQNYTAPQQEFAAAVKDKLDPSFRPVWTRAKNDPPGAQRWVFPGATLFAPTRIVAGHPAPPALTPAGSRALGAFATVLSDFKGTWQRIRIEGHTRPPQEENKDDWELSAARAAVVARRIRDAGHVQTYYLAVSGRAGQNPSVKLILFTAPNTTDTSDTRRIRTNFRRNGVSYSEKRVATTEELPLLITESLRGMGLESQANDLTAQAQGSALPFVLALYPQQAMLISGSDAPGLAKIIQRFPDNDRVEIIVEYTGRRPPK